MGLLFDTVDLTFKKGVDPFTEAFLNNNGCLACPLSKQENTDLQPHGSKKPDVYLLTSYPTVRDFRAGGVFSDSAFLDMIENNLQLDLKYRYNACLRSMCHGVDHGIQKAAIACCRNSVIADIEETKPRLVIGFGNLPLSWVINRTNLGDWVGKCVPVLFGKHACWFMPTFDKDQLEANAKYLNGDYRVRSPFDHDFEWSLRDVRRVLRGGAVPVVHTRERATRNMATIYDLPTLEEAFNDALSCGVVGIDFENYPLRPYKQGKLLSIGVATNKQAFSYLIDHPDSPFVGKARARVKQLFVDFLMEHRGVKAAHNLAHELEWLGVYFGTRYIREVQGFHCTRAMAYVLHERIGTHSLDFLTLQRFGLDLKSIVPLNVKDLRQEPGKRVLTYNCLDARYARNLFLTQRRELRSEGLYDFYEKEHVPRISTLVLTQIKGVPVNEEYVAIFSAELQKKLAAVNKKIKREMTRSAPDLADSFNPASERDVKKVFKVLGYSLSSTDKKALATVDHPLAKLLIQYRAVAKLKGTYSDEYKAGSKIVHAHKRFDLCFHPIINSLSTITGRTSSEEPNSQNIPSRSAEAKRVRQQMSISATVVKRARRRGKQYFIMKADYGQIEARVVGVLSKCRHLCRAVLDGYDIHGDYARRIATRYPKVIGGKKFLNDADAMKKFRSAVKNQMVFPAFYNSSLRSISRSFGLEEAEMRPLFDQFWDEFHEVKAWQEAQKRFYERKGYIEAITGRRFHGFMTPNQLANYPIQHTAANIALDAMVRLSQRGDFWQPNMYIHDDLTFWICCDPRKKDWVIHQIVKEMVRPTYAFLIEPVFDDVVMPISLEVEIGETGLHDTKFFGEFRSDKMEF